jgi:hypothetical protein
MEMLSALLLLLVSVALIAYAVITEATDWIGRAEIIETRWPRVWGMMNNRPMRLILVVVALVMLAHIIQDLRIGTDAPTVVLKTPAPPMLEQPKAEPPESPTSLRRRTMKAANEVSDFLRSRYENHPPYAYPNSNEPNPSEERKATIQKCLKYDQETTDEYMRRYKDRMVGIVSEYRAKGVPISFLEQSLSQRVPLWAQPGSAWEENPQYELGQFRELAYHVDAKDQMISPNF